MEIQVGIVFRDVDVSKKDKGMSESEMGEECHGGGDKKGKSGEM